MVWYGKSLGNPHFCGGRLGRYSVMLNCPFLFALFLQLRSNPKKKGKSKRYTYLPFLIFPLSVSVSCKEIVLDRIALHRTLPCPLTF